jgi:hypothetical protein
VSFQSQAGQVGFKTQSTPGSYADPGATAPNNGVFMRLRSGSLAANRELLIPDPEIGGGRDVPDAYLGAVSFSGEYDFYARSNSAAVLLKGALGTVVSGTPAQGATQHTITPTDDALPWLSVEEAVGNGFEVFRYVDAKVNTFHLEADANGYLMGTAGLIARQQSAGHDKTAVPTWDTNPMIVGTNITVSYAGVTLPAKSFSFDVNNNLEDDDFRLGSFFLGSVTEKRREVTAGFSLRPSDAALWRQAVYGASAATEPGGLVAKHPLIITANSYEPAGTHVTWKHGFSITVPTAAFQPFAVEPSGDDVLEFDVTVQALRPNPANPITTVVVTNASPAVA